MPVYGVVPPLAVTSAAPSVPPLQETFATTEHVATSAAGSEMVTEQDAVQPFASDMLYVYDPAARPVNEPVPV